jgi:DNA polymerase sigma
VRSLDKYFNKELQTLYFVAKVLLVSKNIHKPWKGGIGSFVLINLITAFLQDEYKKKLEDSNPREAHYLFIQFCRFIGFELKHKDVGVSIL